MPTFIIHGTFYCNATCKHCGVYFLNKYEALPVRELISILETIVDLSSEDKTLELIFHGGEPFVLGVDYYRDVLKTLDKLGYEFEASFQTNLTLYNDDWAKFFKEFNVRASTSYDFFADFRQLPGKNSKQYFELWLDKVKKFQDDFGQRVFTITVMSKQNKDRAKEIIDIGYELGLNLKLNPLYSAGKAVDIYDDIGLTPEEYGQILVDAYKQWQKYKDSGMIFEQGKEFEDYVSGIDNKPMTKCPYSGICVGYIWGISPEGYIYNCGDSIQMGKYCFGQADNLDKQEILKARQEDIIVNTECYTCGICGGGCKLFRDETNKTVWCKSYKMLYSEIAKNLCEME